MKTLTACLLVGLLVLWTELPSTTSNTIPAAEKPGNCPPDPFLCTLPGPNSCSSDGDCPEKEKCCPFNCGTMCRAPK
ncbi:waprin-Enh1-like [Elgaria multicarinata webbii]|uniref:waprin-Enh1-like n=1 Tax=Elgaria multicarinata webbii TaxID=159646 RepID=UPI002FCD4F97